MEKNFYSETTQKQVGGKREIPLSSFNDITQVALPVMTITAQVAISLKMPQWGLIITLLSQPFWFYTSWKSYKQAGQIGLLVTAVLVTIVTSLGIINYRITY